MTTVQSHVEKVSDSAPLLSIVLPVYNGGTKIEHTIDGLRARMRELESLMFSIAAPVHSSASLTKYTTDVSRSSYISRLSEDAPKNWYELIVVNDGSIDNTDEILRRAADQDINVRTISFDSNMGKGYAIRRGVLESRGSYIVFMDGDGEIDAGIIASFLHGLQNADIAIASKYHPESVVRVPGTRRFLSRCFNLFVRSLIPLKVSDTQVGLKAGRRNAFKTVFDLVHVKRYAFDVEMLAVAQVLQLKVVEMPVKIELNSQFRKKEIVRMVVDVLGVAYRLRFTKNYHKEAHDTSTSSSHHISQSNPIS